MIFIVPLRHTTPDQLTIDDLPLIWTSSPGDILSIFRSAFNGFREYTPEQIYELMGLIYKGKPRIREDGQPCNPKEIIAKLLKE